MRVNVPLFRHSVTYIDVPNYTSIFIKFAMYAVTIFIGMVVADYVYDESMDYYFVDAYDRIILRFKSIGYLGLGAGMRNM